MPDITGFGHVDLSVTDLDRSEAWYTKVLGAKRIVAQRVDDPGYEVRVFVEPKSMALFALFGHDHNAQQPSTFDFNRSGLDHLAFGVADADSLDAWGKHLTALGVQHNGIEADPFANAIVAKDPDGIPIEFYHFVATDQLAAMIDG
jgi:catechol 2,3-dioxygenase-like lactoylglutathione lyase family enzyme